ncbi:MAG: hypothetical protein U0175_38625 [Caldilineaceae bacterium]
MKLPAQGRYLLLLCVLCLSLLLAACGGDDESAAEPASAPAASSSSGPLKFVYFRSDDCGNQCAEMDPIVDGFVETYKDKLVVEKQDGKSEAGKKLMEQFSLTKIPSYLILDSNGNKLWSNSGPIHKDMLAQQIINLTK